MTTACVLAARRDMGEPVVREARDGPALYGAMRSSILATLLAACGPCDLPPPPPASAPSSTAAPNPLGEPTPTTPVVAATAPMDDGPRWSTEPLFVSTSSGAAVVVLSNALEGVDPRGNRTWRRNLARARAWVTVDQRFMPVEALGKFLDLRDGSLRNRGDGTYWLDDALGPVTLHDGQLTLHTADGDRSIARGAGVDLDLSDETVARGADGFYVLGRRDRSVTILDLRAGELRAGNTDPSWKFVALQRSDQAFFVDQRDQLLAVDLSGAEPRVVARLEGVPCESCFPFARRGDTLHWAREVDDALELFGWNPSAGGAVARFTIPTEPSLEMPNLLAMSSAQLSVDPPVLVLERDQLPLRLESDAGLRLLDLAAGRDLGFVPARAGCEVATASHGPRATLAEVVCEHLEGNVIATLQDGGMGVVEVGLGDVTLGFDEAWVAYERGWRHLDVRLLETGGLGETEGRQVLQQADVFGRR